MIVYLKDGNNNVYQAEQDVFSSDSIDASGTKVLAGQIGFSLYPAIKGLTVISETEFISLADANYQKNMAYLKPKAKGKK